MDLRPIEVLAARYAAERDAALAHDSLQRRAAGVVHTPAELARAVARVSDELLREELRLAAGLCDPELLVIDPACGPGAFLAAVLAQAEAGCRLQAHLEHADLGSCGAAAERADGATDQRSHAAGRADSGTGRPPRLVGSSDQPGEVLGIGDATAARTNAAGARPLQLVGFDIDDAALTWAEQLRAHPLARSLELQHADVLKTDALTERAARSAGPVLVIGNPPWATVRAQPSSLDQQRLAEFRRDVSGARLAERKLGVLSDAYVRFFALCGQVARAADAGALVALVTNASFLDGPVHRGMRARFLEWYDQIYTLDLGGSALLGRRREQRDDNVFGVRPNVAISWLCRYPRQRRAGAQGRARYARLFGSKPEKLRALRALTLSHAGFAAHGCEAPAFSLVPRPRQDSGYAAFLPLSEWLPFHREGVQSNRDAVVFDTSAERLRSRLQAFCRGERLPELALAYQSLPHYDPARARLALAEALRLEAAGTGDPVVQRIAYRPWDERVFCDVAPLCHRPRPMLRAALAHGGIALLSVRKDRGDLPWRHASAAVSIADNCYLSARSSCRARVFPSFMPEGEQNLSSRARELLAAIGCESSGSVAVQHYLLALLSAASYQRCWDSELHHDYPRVPAPRDAASFRALAALGGRLAELHGLPCETAWSAPTPESSARYRDIELDVARGQLRLHGSLLIAPGESALALRVGHWRPLAAYIAQRANHALDSAGLAAVYARAERLGQLASLLDQIDHAVSECFGPFRRA